MNLTVQEAISRIKEPRHAKEIRKAVNKRVRHRLHTESETDADSGTLSLPHLRFLSWVRAVLRSDENFERWRQLYRPPIYTNELIESIFSQFQRVFEAQNGYEKFFFEDPELEADAVEYRKRIGDLQFWETQGFEAFRNSIDDVLIIDMPKVDDQAVTSDSRPMPFYYLLDIDDVIDIDNRRVKGAQDNGDIMYYFKTEYVIFRGKKGDAGQIVYVFDDTFWRTFLMIDTNNITLISEVPHDLGFCPARSFWTDPLNSKTTILKRGPITNSLSELDWLLFFSIARKYLELYAPFPLYAIYKGACNYKEEGARKAKCVDGWLAFDGSDKVSKEKCPKCSNKIKVGPGGIIELRVPKDKEDPDLMANPMKVIPAERTSLDYMREALAEKWDEIFQNCVGRGGDTNTDQAQNELQIRASFESRTGVLLRIKRNFEIAHTFALNTVYRLRYGDAYKGCVINYGDQFFTKDESAQANELDQAIKNGAPSYEIDARRRELYATRYKNNPEGVQRMDILRNLEPWPDKDLKAVLDMQATKPQLVSSIDLVIKSQFNSFIDRFEREQANIITFGRALDFFLKINLIRVELVAYAQEYLDSVAMETGGDQADPNALSRLDRKQNVNLRRIQRQYDQGKLPRARAINELKAAGLAKDDAQAAGFLDTDDDSPAA